jgi:hypothetical protein
MQEIHSEAELGSSARRKRSARTDEHGLSIYES